MRVNLSALASQLYNRGKQFFVDKINDHSRQRFDRAKSELIRDILAHPVSREINDENSSNISGTLNGARGNLFSFFGFNSGTKPMDDLVYLIEQTVNYIPAKTISIKGLTRVTFTYPSKSDFLQLPLVWEPGRSWVNAIEDGVGNLGFYLFKYSQASRSGQGIQSKYKVSDNSFKSVPYMTPIIQKFIQSLNG